MNMGIFLWMKLINDGWLMISWGIIVSNFCWGCQKSNRGIPLNQPGFNGIRKGFWTLLRCFSPNSQCGHIWGSYCRGSGRVFVRGGFIHVRQIWRPLTAQKLLHLRFLTRVSHETISRRPLANPRHFGPLRSLSLWRGATTVWALWACQVPLVAAPCLFCYSRRSCAEILAGRFFYREFVLRSCHGNLL